MEVSQEFVARAAHDGLMNGKIGPEIVLAAFTGGVELDEPLVQFDDVFDFRIGEVGAGKLRAHQLDGTDGVEQPFDLIRIGRCHDRATTRQRFYQALGRQHPDCFPKRRAGNAKLGTEVTFRNPCSGRQFILYDHVAQNRRHLVVEIAPNDLFARANLWIGLGRATARG